MRKKRREVGLKIRPSTRKLCCQMIIKGRHVLVGEVCAEEGISDTTVRNAAKRLAAHGLAVVEDITLVSAPPGTRHKIRGIKLTDLGREILPAAIIAGDPSFVALVKRYGS